MQSGQSLWRTAAYIASGSEEKERLFRIKLLAIRELDSFKESIEGVEALNLLEATSKSIRLAELEGSSGRAIFYELTAGGIVEKIEVVGMAAMARQPEPQVRLVNPEEMIDALAKQNQLHQVVNIMGRIRQELDIIAREVISK
jgi:hypothetical protein